MCHPTGEPDYPPSAGSPDRRQKLGDLSLISSSVESPHVSKHDFYSAFQKPDRCEHVEGKVTLETAQFAHPLDVIVTVYRPQGRCSSPSCFFQNLLVHQWGPGHLAGACTCKEQKRLKWTTWRFTELVTPSQKPALGSVLRRVS